jgi:hypothetical protein
MKTTDLITSFKNIAVDQSVDQKRRFNILSQTLKGTLSCSSEPGTGAPFLIHFPV